MHGQKELKTEDDLLVLTLSTLSAIGLMVLVAFLMWVCLALWKAL